MEDNSEPCEHRWRYFVHLASRSVRARQCDNCGQRSVVPTAPGAPAGTKPERISA